MMDYYVPPAGAAVNLDSATKGFLDALRNGDANLRYGRSERATVGGQPALVTRLTTRTSYAQDPERTANRFSFAYCSAIV